MSTQYGYTHPTSILNNNQLVNSNNPLPVQLGSGTSSLGAVSLLGCNNAPITPSNPLQCALVAGTMITLTASNVTIAQSVTVTSSAADPVHVHQEQQLPPGSNTVGGMYLTNTSNGGVISSANPLAVSVGNTTVNVSNLPSANLIGAVNVWNAGAAITSAAPLSVSLNSTTVAVSNLTGSNYIGSVSISSAANLNVINLSGSNTIGSVYLTNTSNGGVISAANPLAVSVGNTTVNVSNLAGSNTIGGVYLMTTSNNAGSVISSANPLAVSLGTATVTTTTVNQTSSNTIGGVYLMTNSNAGSVISTTNPLPVQLVVSTTNSNTLGSVNILTNYSNVSDINPVITQPASMLLDSFGRTRVSECYTLGDYKHIYGLDPNFQDVVTNGGTTTFVKNKACCTLTTSSASNSSVIHQTKQYHNYMPGKSQLIYSSICFGAWQSNVVKRTGYFDNNDGIYFEQNGSTGSNGMLTLNIRSYNSGSPVIRSVAQSDWNHDRLDGTGPSGLTMDITKTQLFIIDFKWLGVGSVRCAFGLNGQIIQVHEFFNANVLPTVYMANPSLPIRCEILNTGTTTGGSMDQICSTVISEGGYVETGIDYSLNGAIVTLPGVQYASAGVLAIRLSSNFFGYSNRIFARLNNVQVCSFDQPITYSVLKVDSSVTNISGGSWKVLNGNSGIEYNHGPLTVSGNLQDAIASGIVLASSGKNGVSSSSFSSGSSARRNFISQNLQCNDSSAYVVYCSNLATTGAGNTADVIASIQWREVY